MTEEDTQQVPREETSDAGNVSDETKEEVSEESVNEDKPASQ